MPIIVVAPNKRKRRYKRNPPDRARSVALDACDALLTAARGGGGLDAAVALATRAVLLARGVTLQEVDVLLERGVSDEELGLTPQVGTTT
jgi:hypothetical protein